MKILTLIMIALTVMVFAHGDDKNDSKIELIGSAWYQGGQIYSGSYQYSNDIKKYWYQKVFANLGFKKKVNHWLSITAAIEACMRYSFKKGSTFPESQRYSHNIYIDEARGDISFGDSQSTRLQLTLGYFRFNYNKDVRNLGNNLFNSYSYPTAITSREFDFPYTRLCGIDLNTTFLGGLIFNDFLATVHVEFYPVNDLSLTDILGFYWRGIRVGAGIQLDRIVPMDDEITTPDFASRIDPQYPSDTVCYTFASTKFMTCVNIDIKKIIFGEDYPTFFGENDAKLFFEMNILGLKNYYHFYENRKERIPIVFGVQLPTFKILDLLSLEFEYFSSPYPNSIDRPFNSNTPFPEIQEYYYNPDDFKNDNWKWSWYAMRSFSNFSIILGIVCDHLQPWSVRPVDQVFHDVLIESGKDFYYQFKFLFSF